MLCCRGRNGFDCLKGSRESQDAFPWVPWQRVCPLLPYHPRVPFLCHSIVAKRSKENIKVVLLIKSFSWQDSNSYLLSEQVFLKLPVLTGEGGYSVFRGLGAELV